MTDTTNPARLLVRDLIADLVVTDQPDTWNVIAEARTPDAVVRRTAVVWTGEIARTGYARGRYITSTVELWLLPPSDLKPAALEDAADAMLATIVPLLEATRWVSWTTAKRSTLDGAWHGWHLTLTVAHKITTTDTEPTEETEP